MSGPETHADARSPLSDMTGCGARLRALREQWGLSPQELSAQLNLDVKKILALEADNFEALTAALYVRGYIRAVARLFEVDAGPLIEAYERMRNDRDPELTAISSGPPIQPNSRSRWVRATTLLVAVSLTVLLILWWQNSEVGSLIASRFGTGTAPDAVAPEPAAPPPETPAEAPISARFSTVSLQPSPPPEFDVVESTGLTPATAPLPGPMAAAAGEPPSQPAPAQAPDEPVILQFDEESWVEITDADDRVLFTGLAGPARPINVSGAPPYQLHIGHSSAVARLLFHEQEIDVAPYTRQGVARLTLPLTAYSGASAPAE